MKRLLLLTIILFFLGLLISAWLFYTEDKQQLNKDLPWKIEISETGATKVFGLDVGRLTLEEMMLSLHKIADVSIFEARDGKLSLEAYFGKTRLGIFDAILIADVDADQVKLREFLTQVNPSDKEATPSGNWKYALAESSIKQANKMRVWRLVYIPSANYEAVTIRKQFGEPESTETLPDDLVYWFYPQKGVAILQDPNGREIFYYVAADEFDRLKVALPRKKPEIK